MAVRHTPLLILSHAGLAAGHPRLTRPHACASLGPRQADSRVGLHGWAVSRAASKPIEDDEEPATDDEPEDEAE